MSRKYKILIASLIFYFITVLLILFVRDEGDIAGIIVAIATGITTITGAYYAGNVWEKMKENK